MGKVGTFDLEDLGQELQEKIVFLELSYGSGLGGPGCIIFLTDDGVEYYIDEVGTDTSVHNMVKLFPEVYKCYRNIDDYETDEIGFVQGDKWNAIHVFAGVFFVRKTYYDKFCPLYMEMKESDRDFLLSLGRKMLGIDKLVTFEDRMVYIKSYQKWEEHNREVEKRERERKENRLTEQDVPWVVYSNNIANGLIWLLIRKESDGKFSVYRWLIQGQRETEKEGCYRLEAPIECYNLFLNRLGQVDEEGISDTENIYRFFKCDAPGEFIRSYKTIEKAKVAAQERNDWSVGWGNVNKLNVFKIDYEKISHMIAEDKSFFILQY